MFYVPQSGTLDCGFACLKMILANALKDKQYLHLPCDENHGVYSYRDLEKIAMDNGVTLCGFKVGDKRELLKCTHFPIIIRIKADTALRHAVVVTKVTKKKAWIYDPHLGKYTMSFEELLSIWDSTGLWVSDAKRVPYIYEKFEPISKGKKFLAFLLQLFSGAAVATGIYFINPDGPYLISIICLVIGLFFEVILRVYLYSLMHQIDNYFENKYDNVPNELYYEYYVRSQNFKKNYLSIGLNLMYSIIVSVFLIFVIIFNNPMNFPLVIVAILIGAVEQVLFRKKEDKRMKELADQEELLKENSSREETVMKVKTLQENAYSFSREILAKRLFRAMLCLLTAALVQIITNSFTLTNVIFSLCLELFLYQNVLPIFSYERHKEEEMFDKAKLSNIFYTPIHHKDEMNGK